jgi:RNA polymerase sigma-70 factor, ECF subfamily
LARLIRVLGGDFALAEEVLQEAFAAALVQWPGEGIPPVPRAWLLRSARNKAIDRLRRRARFEAPLPDLEGVSADLLADGADEALPEPVEDDLLRLIFTCCHPALALEAQVALTLRTLCGLSTEEIARAFLVEPSAMSQRLVRAQNKIKVAKIPYEVPERRDLPERLDAVQAALYLVFSEGYAATRGDDLVRQDLCAQAIRLGLLLEQLLPERPEPMALVALMLLHDARRAARVNADGDLVLLEDQDRSLWDAQQISAGLVRVERALRLGGPTVYGIQAAIAALHARAKTPGETDWPQIALLYAELRKLSDTPVVALNQAVAVAMAEGPARGLALLDALEGSEELASYHLLSAARADLLRRLGDYSAARAHYERALTLTHNQAEQRYLTRRLAELVRDAP